MTPDGIDTMDVVLREHDLAHPCDYREEAESLFDIESRAAIRVKDLVDLKREWSAAQLAQDPDNYLAGAKLALAGPDKWAASGGDPVGVVEQAKETLRERIGTRPNTIVMGAKTYAALKFHEKLQKALGANERKLITVEHLRALFGIDSIHIGEAIAGDTETGDVWGDCLILAYVGRGGSHEEPSFGYTLRRKGMPETDRYEEVGGKVSYVRHTDIYKAVIVGADAGYLITGAAS